jgi:hypothetical protein
MNLATTPKYTTSKWLTCVNSLLICRIKLRQHSSKVLILQVALGFRENALRESIQVVEEVEPEAAEG